ncbi:MAG: hypothetical protein CMJ78_02995 [Planctomycetaceae bacterium]|nr:hypothetical protein [Planctomycetaceae bacterium]
MWHYGEPVDGILRVRIEQEDRPVNAFNRQALDDLSGLVVLIKGNSTIKGVLFYSGKKGNFIVGADVTELKDLNSEDAAREISEYGQKVFQQVEDLGVTTVALISGACLGGGLEFAMACDYRIAANDPKTLLGLPEVMLGLIPGWGGTVRLPKLVGFIEGMQLILTGKRINGFQARSRGLVHDVVPPEALQMVGAKIMKTILASSNPRSAEAKLFRPKKKGMKQKLMATGPACNFALKKAREQVQKNTNGHYPAPFAVLDCLQAARGANLAKAFQIESQTVSKLGANPVTTECMRLFFLQEEAKKPPADLTVKREANSIQRGAVLGAGAMGAGIALLMAKKGIWTRLKDIKTDFVSNGMKTVRDLVGKDVKRKRLSKVEAMNALDHISPTIDYRGLKNADIVIEAVIEDLDIKRQVFRELAEATGPETVLATNTSSLLVEDIARDIPHPERIVGLHFFNPPHKMPLIEVIRTPQTSDHALATAFALVQRLGKTGVVAGDCTGFLVNRLLSPYMNEAGFLLLEVDDPMAIERAAIAFGMPMGPLELTQLVGVDVAAHVAENMQAAYGDRMAQADLWKRLQHINSGEGSGKVKLLKKTKEGKQLNPAIGNVVGEMRRESGAVDGSLTQDEIIKRLIYPVINEAAMCLEEGMAARPEDVDIAMVFGTGFAPFRGGPLRYADSVGVDSIVTTLSHYAEKNSRLAPSEALKNIAAGGQGFVPLTQNDNGPVNHPEVAVA